MSNAAQDEFNRMVESKDKSSHHPEDMSDGEESDTLVDDKTDRVSSVRSGKLDGGNSSDEDSDSYHAAHRKPATYTLPKNYTYHANTGPKGVIADAQAFELEKSVGNKKTYLRTEAFVLPKNQRVAQDPNKLDEGDTEEDLDVEEDDFEDDDGMLRKWRAKRAGELRKGMQHRKSGETRGRYGTMHGVDAMGFLDAVEKVPAGTIVVVYVFDDELPLSDAYQSHIAALASKHAHIKFVALHFEEAEIEHAGVPAVLAYRNGEQFAGLIPLKNDVSFAGDVATNLEEAFRSHGIL